VEDSVASFEAKGEPGVEISPTEYRILQMLGDGRSVADIQESMSFENFCSKQEVHNRLASLLERKLAVPSSSGIVLSPLGFAVLRDPPQGGAGLTPGS